MRDNRIRIGEPTYYSGIDDLSTLSDRDRIAWFAGRLDKTVVRPLRAVRAIGADNPDIWDLNLGVVTIICCAIEALGSFYAPTSKDRIAFDQFVCEFMNPIFKTTPAGQPRRYAQILYDQFRSGLAHGFTIVGHEIATRPGEYIVDDNGYISIDLWTLFEDMEAAFGRYLEAVDSDAELRARFLTRFDNVFVRPYSKRGLTAAAPDGGGTRAARAESQWRGRRG
jgi:hypothetical protein